jgi:hypothetical protein
MRERPEQCDVCLLLRAHAEGRWLTREALPVVLQLETPYALPEEQLGAALAYLEVTWVRAQLLGFQSDATLARLRCADEGGGALATRACRYYAATRRLRETLAPRVARLLGPIGSKRHGGQATHGRGGIDLR